jgi:hypothetical protein
MSRTLADLDAARSRSFAKGHGQATPLTAAEQQMRERAERALSSFEKAKRGGNPIDIAKARLAAERVLMELQQSAASRGSLETMRFALARSMSKVTVS